MIQLKPGVRITGIRPETVLAIQIAHSVWKELREPTPLTITSVVEGTHSQGSLHYVGAAVDLRKLWTPGFTAMLRDALGEEFDVVSEGNHIHVEFQPKKGVNL